MVTFCFIIESLYVLMLYSLCTPVLLVTEEYGEVIVIKRFWTQILHIHKNDPDHLCQKVSFGDSWSRRRVTKTLDETIYRSKVILRDVGCLLRMVHIDGADPS
jgi:hypothetical protein